MGENAFSHGHFSRGRNVKGNGYRESRKFDRNNKAKAKRHSFWTYNAERRLQRDMRSVQRRMEEINLVAKEMKEMGTLYDVYDDTLDLQAQDVMHDAHGNEYPSLSTWISEQADVAHNNRPASIDAHTIDEPYTPATTWTNSSTPSTALYTPSITSPQSTELSPMTEPDAMSYTLQTGFDQDFILFDDGTGSEIDFDNMSDADPMAFPPLF